MKPQYSDLCWLDGRHPHYGPLKMNTVHTQCARGTNSERNAPDCEGGGGISFWNTDCNAGGSVPAGMGDHEGGGRVPAKSRDYDEGGRVPVIIVDCEESDRVIARIGE